MPRYTLDSPHLPDSLAAGDHFDGNWLCSHCHEPLLPGQWIRQQALYKLGELDSIPIAHAACAPDYDNADVDPTQSEPNLYAGVVAPGDRLRWPGSGPAWHVALGPVVRAEHDEHSDVVPARLLVRVRSPSGRHLDAAPPMSALEVVRDGRTCLISRDARVPCNLCDWTCPNYQPTEAS